MNSPPTPLLADAHATPLNGFIAPLVHLSPRPSLANVCAMQGRTDDGIPWMNETRGHQLEGLSSVLRGQNTRITRGAGCFSTSRGGHSKEIPWDGQ